MQQTKQIKLIRPEEKVKGGESLSHGMVHCALSAVHITIMHHVMKKRQTRM